MRILTVNTGSSSLKAGIYQVETGSIRKTVSGEAGSLSGVEAFTAALQAFLDHWGVHDCVDAVGHRLVVAGEDWPAARGLDAAALAELRGLIPAAPDHLPQALALIESVTRRWPRLPQTGCSDSAFHRTLPEVARAIALPEGWLTASGGARITRHGYHGLSCESVMAALEAEGSPHAGGRVIIAHLGNGCSLTAVRSGQSIETTMGFSPLGGVPMSTRSGDLDPGVLVEVLRRSGLSAEALNHGLNHASGLLALSGLSGDMRELLAAAPSSPGAARAVAGFIYQVRKSIGALAAVLGGVELLVFTGGIGEHAAEVRERIGDGLKWLGMEVRVITANEDERIARHTAGSLREGRSAPPNGGPRRSTRAS